MAGARYLLNVGSLHLLGMAVVLSRIREFCPPVEFVSTRNRRKPHYSKSDGFYDGLCHKTLPWRKMGTNRGRTVGIGNNNIV